MVDVSFIKTMQRYCYFLICANKRERILHFLCKCMEIKTIEKQEKDTPSSIVIGFSGIEI